jgi:hypothetical protein
VPSFTITGTIGGGPPPVPVPTDAWGLIVQGIEELFAGNPQGWTDLFNGILQLLHLARAKPGVSPIILQLIDTIVQFVGTQFGLPQAWINAIEAIIAQLLGNGVANEFHARHANVRRQS